MVTHLLKLIRSRLGGSCWILVELLVVFVILWFMMYYFVAQGMLTRMPVGFKLDHVYNVTLAIRPSDSPSFIAYEEGSEEPVRNIERIVERIERHPDVEVVGLSYYSLPYTDSNIGSRVLKDSINQRVRAMIVSPGYFRVFGIRSAKGESPERLGQTLSRLREGREMILSADLASKLYGHTDVIGAEIYNYNDTVPCHVIAVTEPVRNSEYDSRNQHSVFSPLDLWGMFGKGQLDEKGLMRVQITFRVRPEVSTSNYTGLLPRELGADERPSAGIGHGIVLLGERVSGGDRYVLVSREPSPFGVGATYGDGLHPQGHRGADDRRGLVAAGDRFRAGLADHLESGGGRYRALRRDPLHGH